MKYFLIGIKILLQTAVVVGIYQVGVLLNKYIFEYIPATIYGLSIMFAFLYFKILKLSFFKETSDFTLSNLALFFIPACIGIFDAYHLFHKSILSSLLVISISTIATIILSSKLIETSIKKDDN
ncbi:MAG: CidA/LrgA family protein [Marinifilaceae bacterium]|jgi:holin-like protein|nr:CidA/LrgA family protein [Marinifilaceae bacterium]